MPPNIALFICLIFILFSLIQENKLFNSSSIWIPIIWICILGSRSPAYWLDPTATVAAYDLHNEGSPINRYIIALLMVAGMAILAKRQLSWAVLFKNNPFILLLFCYGIISVVWSDFPIISLKRFMKTSGSFIMALILLTDDNYIDAIKSVMRRCSYILIPLSFLFIKYFPHIGRSYHRYTDEMAIRGVSTGKNGLAALCLTMCLFLFWDMLTSITHKKHLYVNKINLILTLGIFLMSLWILVKSNSATSFICFIVGLILLLILEVNFIRKQFAYIHCYIFLIMIIILFYFAYFSSTPMISDTTGHASTFIGRIILWHILIGMTESPLFGTGYDSFWLGDRLSRLWEMYWWGPTQAHSGYVETYIEQGIIGIFLLMILITATLKNIKLSITNKVYEYSRFRMAFFF